MPHRLLLADETLLQQLTAVVRSDRAIIIERRLVRSWEMGLKLSRLSDKAMKARSNIEALDRAYDDFNNKAGNHAAEVSELTAQIGEMQSDLNFAVGTLGNSVAASNAGAGEGQQRLVVSQNGVGVTQQPETETHAQTASASPPEVGQGNTFQGS